MTILLCWVAFNVGFFVGAWWSSRRWLRRINELSRGIVGDEWKRN